MTLRNSWLALLLGSALFGAPACDLNPQPEVPSGAAAAAGSSSGGFGAADAGSGIGGAFSGGASGAAGAGNGTGSGGSGGGALADCLPSCNSGEVCNLGKCLDDPCEPNACDAKQACKPNADFSASGCFDSCAGVTCGPAQQCDDGKCSATGCSVTCDVGEVCLPVADGGYSCLPDPCATDAGALCGANLACDPLTLACVSDPCIGVKCPSGQLCNAGQCAFAADAGNKDGGNKDAGGSTDAAGD